MANKLILGASGFDKLALGYELNVSQIRTRGFTVAATESSGIVPGDLLAVTSSPYVYKKFANKDTDKVAGIALATNVKVDPIFAQSATEVKFEAGERGAALVQGDIAVKLHGTAPTEGAAVYYSVAQGAFTATSTDNYEVKGARFTGQTEGNVTVVYVQYI